MISTRARALPLLLLPAIILVCDTSFSARAVPYGTAKSLRILQQSDNSNGNGPSEVACANNPWLSGCNSTSGNDTSNGNSDNNGNNNTSNGNSNGNNGKGPPKAVAGADGFDRCPVGCKPNSCIATTAGAYTCISCLGSLVVNTTDGSCGCPAGRYAKSADTCGDCPKGSFCPGGRYEGPDVPSFVGCGNGMTTNGQRSPSTRACVNVPGTFFAEDAEGKAVAVSCPPNTYSSGLKKQRACVPCPPGSTTAGKSGQTSGNACDVPSGYFAKNPGLFLPCPRGEYKEGVGPAKSCTKCAQGVTTPTEASPAASSCNMLLPGYYPVSVAGGAVVTAQLCPQSYLCPGGSASAAFDPEGQPNELTNTTVLKCPNGTWTQALGSSSEHQCMTPPGFQTVGGLTTECPDGHFRAEWMPPKASAQCESCGTGISSAPSDQVTVYAANGTASIWPVKTTSGSCYVRAGQGVSFSSATNTFIAVDCNLGKYGIANATYGLFVSPCRPCPAHMTTSTTNNQSRQYYMDYGNGRGGFFSEKACIAPVGWGYDGRQASRCRVGSYNSGAVGPCTQCPYGMTTADDADLQGKLDDCMLAPGFGYHDSTIVQCPVGFYNDVPQSNRTKPCKPCPTGTTTSEQGGSSVSHCELCAAGYGGSDCSTPCGGSTAGYSPSARPPGSLCLSCPDQTVGFSFDYLAVNRLFQPAVVTRLAASSAADCLNEFSQIIDAAWYLGGSVTLTNVSGVTSLEACAANCKADNDCQYITFNYDLATCWKKRLGSGSDVIAFKATVAGDTSAASRRSQDSALQAHSLSSGAYTFWRDDGSNIGTSVRAVVAASVTACLSACDDDQHCAAVIMQGTTSMSSAPTSCKVVSGDDRVGVFSRTLLRTVVSRLSLPA